MRFPCVTAALLLLGAPPVRAELVEIGVEITEVDEEKARELGVAWLDGLLVREGRIPGLLSVGALERLTPFAADLKFLASQGAAELLANPKLVTDAGSPARFRAGGEIPYIVSGSGGSADVDFKPYGVVLEILPRLAPSGEIQTTLRASVSSLDPNTGTSLSGNAVPGILEREVSSLLTVRSGTTIALAGLVQKKRNRTVRGVPGLSWIPFLGRLFSREGWKESKTTLVIFVTPRLMEEGA